MAVYSYNNAMVYVIKYILYLRSLCWQRNKIFSSSFYFLQITLCLFIYPVLLLIIISVKRRIMISDIKTKINLNVTDKNIEKEF